ncbi:carbohydrate-binding domain-containing protein [Kitasatospora paranensis]|uniref:Carbohydrate-binding domain-containing protein n=1 Tax=Kitasatospora paranensis TaxID=258053 RepID=A0ABW2FQB0_9ACTN
MKRTPTALATAIGTFAALAVAFAPAAGAETAPNGYPYCVNGSASDPDGDGWGWENNQSCVVRGSGADSSGGGSSTSSCPSGMTCGSYSVSGLGSRKSQVRAAGGTSLDLAVAMLETDTMTADYAYGDNKTGDAANFGIFKQNWMMLRAGCQQFSGQSAGQYNNGSALNGNLGQDVSCLHQSQSHYGIDAWFAGHRNGSSGLSNPNTTDINNYKTAVHWIKAQIDANSANLGNDTRYWVQVPAI